MLDLGLATYAQERASFVPGCESMKLQLVYSGPLPSRGQDPGSGKFDGKAGRIHEIRRQFHPQLKHFWETSSYLQKTAAPTEMSHMSPIGASEFIWGGYKKEGIPLVQHVADNFKENGYRFAPLVCEEWSLSCDLHILFLRRDPPGAVVHHGDLDNRLKSLIDGLRKPNGANEVREHPTPGAEEDPFYVLLQDDKLITGFRVETGVLLTPPATNGDDCHIIVTAEIKPYDISVFNLGFY